MEKAKKRFDWGSFPGKEFLPSAIAIVSLLVLGQILSNGFASISNIGNILTTSSILAIAAIGQALVIISGNSGIDMSIGAVISMGALMGPMIAQGTDAGLVLAVLLLICIGGSIGLVNGLGVQYLKIPSLVMTLAMSLVVNGFTLGFTRGQPSILIPKLLLDVGQPIWGPIRYMVAIAILFIVVMELVLRKTNYGKSLYLTGSNRRAAQLSGLHVNRIVILAYVISGVLSAIVGLLLVGYTGSGQLQMGDEYTLLSIAAVVIGGTKLSGGKGRLLGGALGAIVLILITNILVVLGMPAGVRKLVQGMILLVILISNGRESRYRK